MEDDDNNYDNIVIDESSEGDASNTQRGNDLLVYNDSADEL